MVNERKLIIAGSRNFDEEKTYKVVKALYEAIYVDKVNEIVSGACYGVDKAGEKLAKEFNLKLTIMAADWSKGPSAGPARNKKMAKYGDELLLIWDGESSGSKNMKKNMKKLKKNIVEIVAHKKGGV